MGGLILGCAGHLLLYAKGPPEPRVQDLALSCTVHTVKSLCWVITVAESLLPLGSCRELAARGLKGDGDIAWVVEAELIGNISMVSVQQVRLWDHEISEPVNLFHKPALHRFRTLAEGLVFVLVCLSENTAGACSLGWLLSSSSRTACTVCMM